MFVFFFPVLIEIVYCAHCWHILLTETLRASIFCSQGMDTILPTCPYCGKNLIIDLRIKCIFKLHSLKLFHWYNKKETLSRFKRAHGSQETPSFYQAVTGFYVSHVHATILLSISKFINQMA